VAMRIETVKFYSFLAAMALLFGAVNLGLWLFTPFGFVTREYEFETAFPLLLIIVEFFSSGFIPAIGFYLVFQRYDKIVVNQETKKPKFFNGLAPGFIGSILLGIACLRGFGRSDIDDTGVIFAFLILVVAPSMILGGMMRRALPGKPYDPILIPVIVFAGGMSSYLSLKVLILFFFH
jgi:hypothetical protein